MIIPQIDIKTYKCNELVITDITPDGGTHGYGGLNTNREEIGYVELTFDFGRGIKPKVGKVWNPNKGSIVIDVEDLNMSIDSNGSITSYNTVTVQGECGQVCDICIPGITVELDSCGCKPKGFPEGCVKITFEIFSKHLQSGLYKSEGLNIVNFISTCNVEKDLADLAFKIRLPTCNKPYKFNPKGDDRNEVMQNVILAWQKLNLLTEDSSCDCDCIALQLKQIRNYLQYAKSLI